MDDWNIHKDAAITDLNAAAGKKLAEARQRLEDAMANLKRAIDAIDEEEENAQG